MPKMKNDPGRELKRTWRRHWQKFGTCGCPDCDGVTVALGASRATEKTRWKKEVTE